MFGLIAFVMLARQHAMAIACDKLFSSWSEGKSKKRRKGRERRREDRRRREKEGKEREVREEDLGLQCLSENIP